METNKHIVIGVSDARASAHADDKLINYSLGSCIGVSLYDRHAKIGGMLHYQLPDSGGDAEKAARQPLMYADTGFKWLIDEVERLGGDRRRLSVHVAGAAQMLGDSRLFDIGRRNHAAIRKVLWSHRLFIDGEHVGDKMPRTMSLDLADGSVAIRWNDQVIKF